MKNIAVLLLVFSSLLMACNTQKTENSEDNKSADTLIKSENIATDYSGTYKTEDATCTLSIVISKSENQYSYVITETKKEYKGNLSIENSDGEVYFTFDSEIGDNKAGSISAKYENNTLIIQNYGNAMNEYHFFKQCDLKYIELTKQN
jgi:hypothetical protein